MPGKSKIWLFLFLLGVIFPTAVNAQVGGSISGTIYGDTNKDGYCVNSGEPPLPGVPVEIVFQQDGTAVTVTSGADGRYGLATTQFGTWTVTAKPPAGFYVSSGSPVIVTLSDSQPEVVGVDICVATLATTGPITLPESGATIAPPVYAVIGGLLILIGAGVEIRRRRKKRT